MVFTGRPSTGCAMCKQRKKKCDRTKPQCRQCINLGKPCPGVPDELDVIFRHQFSRQQVSDDHAPNASPGYARRLGNVPLPMISEDSWWSQDLIARSIPTDWTTAAITYYFKIHFPKSLSTIRLNPWLEVQSEFYASSIPGTSLHHAVTALAAITMSSDLRLPHLRNLATVSYGKALRAANEALADPSQSRANDLVVSIFAMTSFELKQSDPGRFARYKAHLDGMKRLLVFRGRDQLTDFRSLRVFRALRVQIIYDHILLGKPLLGEYDEVLWADANPYNASPVDELCSVAAQIPEARAQAKKLNHSTHGRSISRLVEYSRQVDMKMVAWFTKWRDHLQFQVQLSLKDSPDFWHARMHSFTDLAYAVLMNHYCFLRIQLLDTIFEALSRVPEGASHRNTREISEVVVKVQDLLDQVCYSIPFITMQLKQKKNELLNLTTEPDVHLSHAEATWILMPIVVLAQRKMTDREQKEWLWLQLKSMNTDFGLLDAGTVPRDTKSRLAFRPESTETTNCTAVPVNVLSRSSLGEEPVDT